MKATRTGIRFPIPVVGYALAFVLTTTAWGERFVNESARQIPVAYDVDVLVVGGGTAAVAAATSAAESGARVFLAAPHPYLGDDMTASLRLWLEEGEEPVSPMAKKIFQDEQQAVFGPDPDRIEFSYEADRPSAPLHRDTSPPSLLTDGMWQVSSSQSVQFDGDVTILADLKEVHEVAEVRVMAFYRGSDQNGTAFVVESVGVSTSDDKKTWHSLKTTKNTQSKDPTTLTVPVNGKTRYVKIEVKKTAKVERILLGEIEIVRPAKVSQPRPRWSTPRPMHVKKTLDELLLAAGVEFLYSCYPTDLLRDASGAPAGIVMANRAGRQAVIARTIVDTSDRGVVARMAGAKFRPYPAGMNAFTRVVIGGEPLKGDRMTSRFPCLPFTGKYPNPAKTSSGQFNVIEYTLQLPMKDDSWPAWAKAEQLARSMTYHPEQQFTGDLLHQIPPDPMIGRESATGDWRGIDAIPLGVFQSADAPRVFILGPAADISRSQAESLMRPLNLIDMGTRIGVAAARDAKSRSHLEGACLPGKTVDNPAATGDVGEMLTGVRPTQSLKTVPQHARAIPVLAEYDVVVIGGGTGGAPAGIGAARAGANTLVVEYLHGLGGVGTVGAISKYYWGNRVGFTAEMGKGASWVIEQKVEWYRKQLLEAGGDLWFGTIGCGAFVEDGVVKGAVVVTPQGRGVVLADVVIDTTGNSDIAAAAGANTYYTDHTELAMQGTGLPPRMLGATYTNTDFTITDETDIVDVWHMFVYSKNKYPKAFDHGRLIDTRERRRIVGEFTMSLLDQVLQRTYPDTIEVAFSNFDSHGYTIEPYLEIEHPGHKGFRISVPYRCLLPKGLKGILVGGLGMSAHRDAVPMTRMQPDIQNQGYAAGVASAMASEAGCGLREIDLRKLQEHLIEIGNLPESVLTDKDSFPLSAERIAEAVQTVSKGKGAAVLLSHPNVALPLLREAYKKAQGESRVVYAHVLAVLGDASGLETLIAEIRKADEWDKGWNYRGMGQFGTALSRQDRLIIAMGRAGDPEAVPVILERAKRLTVESDFSHHRAVGMALELIGDRSAAKPLSSMLTQHGMSGYVHDSIEEAQRRDAESPGGTTAVTTRRESLRELLLARALFRCGDYGNIGREVLTRYTNDLRGHFARHAKAVLEDEEK